jgi:hypothetical protein
VPQKPTVVTHQPAIAPLNAQIWPRNHLCHLDFFGSSEDIPSTHLLPLDNSKDYAQLFMFPTCKSGIYHLRSLLFLRGFLWSGVCYYKPSKEINVSFLGILASILPATSSLFVLQWSTRLFSAKNNSFAI